MSAPRSLRRVVVVGASAAGLRCAARLARLCPGWSVTVVEQRTTFSYAACGLPYLLSGDVPAEADLRTTADGTLRDPAYFLDVKGFTVRTGWRATGVDTAGRTLTLEAAGGATGTLPWDELVLATGARARHLAGQPDHPRVRSFHVLEDVAPLHGALARGELGSVAVVGAGLVGCELAEAFRALWGAEVTLIEAAPHPLPTVLDAEAAALVARVLEHNGVSLHLGAPVDGIEAGPEAVTVRTSGGHVTADFAVVAAGVVPAAGLAVAAGAALGPAGGILVDGRMATSIPHVWAVGDCVEVPHAVTGRPVHLPLGSLANRQGRTLANVLSGRDDRFPPVAGAVAVKVFDANVAAVGCTRRSLLASGRAARSVWVTAHDRAHYWPEAEEIAIDLVYEPASRKVLGVQAVGAGDVVKRIDVAAQLIVRGATLDDLAALEHAYAPPFAPAVEPLAVAAWTAQNQEEGVEAQPPSTPLDAEAVLDVRHPAEREARPADSAHLTEIPLESLRAAGTGAVPEAPLAVCERGTRAAEAVRWLSSRERPARYLGGGLRWRDGLKWSGPR